MYHADWLRYLVIKHLEDITDHKDNLSFTFVFVREVYYQGNVVCLLPLLQLSACTVSPDIEPLLHPNIALWNWAHSGTLGRNLRYGHTRGTPWCSDTVNARWIPRKPKISVYCKETLRKLAILENFTFSLYMLSICIGRTLWCAPSVTRLNVFLEVWLLCHEVGLIEQQSLAAAISVSWCTLEPLILSL